MAVGHFTGPQAAIKAAGGHYNLIANYHRTNSLVKHSQLQPWYKSKAAGKANRPLGNGLNDLMVFVWKNGYQ